MGIPALFRAPVLLAWLSFGSQNQEPVHSQTTHYYWKLSSNLKIAL